MTVHRSHIQADLHHLIGQVVEDRQAEGRPGRRRGVPGASRPGAAWATAGATREGATRRLHQSAEVLAEGEGGVGRGRGGCGRHRPKDVLGGHEEGAVRVGGRLAQAGRRRG